MPLLVEYPGKLKVNLWEYIGMLIPPKTVKARRVMSAVPSERRETNSAELRAPKSGGKQLGSVRGGTCGVPCKTQQG